MDYRLRTRHKLLWDFPKPPKAAYALISQKHNSQSNVMHDLVFFLLEIIFTYISYVLQEETSVHRVIKVLHF